ncbi:MAG: glycosyltransferase family 92 protein [Chloroflexota bacterium]
MKLLPCLWYYSAYMDYLSLCLICKDENDYLPEWLDYHLLLGVDRFYIYDNDSRVPIQETLPEYIARGRVIVNKISGRAMQLAAYDHCLQTYGEQSTWIGFIDTDEFLVPKTCLDLKEFLKEYEPYAGLAVSSLFFGSNGHQTRPETGQLSAYTKSTHETFVENSLVKSIVQPVKVKFPMTPHDFVYKTGEKCVNENFQRVDTQHFPFNNKKIQLNHYFCRSTEELTKKLERGRGDSGEAWHSRRFDFVNQHAVYPELTVLENLEKKFQSFAARETEYYAGGNDLLLKMRNQVCSMPQLERIETHPIPNYQREEISKIIQYKSMLISLQKNNDYIALKQLLLDNLSENPDSLVLLTDLAKVFLVLKDFSNAWQVLAAAWKLSSESLLVRTYMTYYFLQAANYQMAEKSAHLMLEIAPNDLQAMGFLTEALLGLGRVDEALKIGIPAVELSLIVGEMPENMDTFLVKKMADQLLEQKDFSTAVRLWTLVVRSYPTNVFGHLELSRSLVFAGEKRQARQILRNVRKNNISDTNLLNQIELLDRQLRK